jgi:ATP/ADP translocase
MFQHLLVAAQGPHAEAAGFILRGIKGIIVLIGSVIAAILCAVIAAAKGRSALFYGIVGLFFSILTLIVIIVLPSKRDA